MLGDVNVVVLRSLVKHRYTKFNILDVKRERIEGMKLPLKREFITKKLDLWTCKGIAACTCNQAMWVNL